MPRNRCPQCHRMFGRRTGRFRGHCSSRCLRLTKMERDAAVVERALEPSPYERLLKKARMKTSDLARSGGMLSQAQADAFVKLLSQSTLAPAMKIVNTVHDSIVVDTRKSR